MEDTHSLDGWLSRLKNQDLPILSETDRDVAAISRREESTAAELARAILRDPSMTAHVLRLANSAFYNPSGQPMSTVSRAVIVLGFDAVLSICLSKAVLDSFVHEGAREQVKRTIAHSLHAAVQARAIAAARNDSACEDVFVATLLYRLGEIAMWSYAGEDADRINELVRARGLSAGQAQRQVLGFSATELTARLNEEWQLSQLLGRALPAASADGPQAKTVVLADALVEALTGGSEEALQPILRDIGSLLKKDKKDTQTLIAAGTEQATKLTAAYGLTPRDTPASHGPAGDAAPATQTAAEIHEPYPELQVQILGEVSALLEEGSDLNLLLDMILEGLYRGIGLDRALFALLSPDRKLIRAKYAVGVGSQTLLAEFKLPLGQSHLLDRVLAQGKSCWYRHDSPSSNVTLDQRLAQFTAHSDFFLMPVSIKGKSIGVFYADRHPSDRPLDAAAFTGFKHFCHQAALGLMLLNQ